MSDEDVRKGKDLNEQAYGFFMNSVCPQCGGSVWFVHGRCAGCGAGFATEARKMLKRLLADDETKEYES
jgi:hypothetical protein